MSRLIRLWRGEWKKNATEEWHFEPDPGDFGIHLEIYDDDNYDMVESRVRKHYGLRDTTPIVLSFRLPSWMLSPIGYKTPPTTVNQTEDLCVLLNVTTSISDLALLVTAGPRAVSEYQFLCRTNFTLGSITYVVDNTQNESQRADYESLVYGNRPAATDRVLSTLFSDDALLTFHRISCEMAYADQCVANRNRNQTAEKEIIVVDDDDEVMNDPDPVNVATALHVDGGVGGGISGHGTNVGPVQLTQSEAPPIFWDVGMDLVNYRDPFYWKDGEDVEDNNMTFWEEVIGAGAAIDGQLNIVGGEDEEMVNVGPIMSLEDAPTNVGVDAVPVGVGDEAGVGSSTGSSRNVLTMGEEDVVYPTEMVRLDNPLMASTDEPMCNTTEKGGEGTTLTTTRGDGSLGVLPPAVEQGTCGQITPTLFTVTQGGPMIRASKVKPACKSGIATSPEGSETEGEVEDSREDVAVGMVFSSREAFRQHMALYAIKRKFRYKCAKSQPGLMALQCWSAKCPWRVYAVRLKDADAFEIRKVVTEHLCSVDDRGGYQSQATAAVIGEMMKTKFGGSGSGPSPRDIRQMMRGDHSFNISYWKAWRARDVAVDNMKGTVLSSYSKLPDYLNKLIVSNPGTIVELFTEPHESGGQRYKYLFVALEASIKGFSFMRKVVVIDGTHLKGRYGGCLLTAASQDGNYQIFPLAFAIVDGENDMSWQWFFTNLKKFVPNSEDLVFVSDRHASIYNGITKVYPGAGHCICVVHLKRNIRSNFKGRHLETLVAKAARSFRLEDFNDRFNEIRAMDPHCADYLLEIGFPHWARAHFKGNRYNVMTSNLAESWNSVLREAREYPIIALVEFIRSKLMNWFESRREAAEKSNAMISPRVSAIVTKNFEKSGGNVVIKIREKEFEVRDKEGGSFHVKFDCRSCSCNEFQMLAIPCSHAISAALQAKIPVESLVLPAYGITKLRAAYGGDILPPEGFTGIGDLVDNLNGIHIYPPSTRRPPGRPKKRRFFSRGEQIAKRKRRRTACSRCNQLGHNKATCKEAI